MKPSGYLHTDQFVDGRQTGNCPETLRNAVPDSLGAGSSRRAELRVSLSIDETLAWLLPVQFCIDQLLTAEEVVTKLADAFWFLKEWSQVHAHEGREALRIQCLQAQHPLDPPVNILFSSSTSRPRPCSTRCYRLVPTLHSLPSLRNGFLFF